MIIIGEQVTHCTFGTGEITERDNGRITVVFAAGVGPKMFMYPEAFGQYLHMDKPKAQHAVLQELELKRQQARDEQALQEQLFKEKAEQKAVKAAGKSPSSKKKSKSKAAKGYGNGGSA
jgi:hypothetical protein